jgi:succinate dehydrogenase / fumarate reductase, flavoprotein subunit
MQELVGIVRQEGEMQQAMQQIEQLKQRAERAVVAGHREYNNGWHTSIDLHNLLTISEIITLSALERKESRGGHFRDDYPAKDENYATFNIVARKSASGGVEITREPLRPMPEELKRIVEENK